MNQKYTCLKCGVCCFEIPECPGAKRIPLYPDEVDKLVEVAKEQGVAFRVIEDLVFPDIKNKKILVLTYKVMLDNDTKGCPFFDTSSGCSVHELKPFACQAYPLSLKRIDSFNLEITIDPLCNWVIAQHDFLKDNANLDRLKEIFLDEFPKAEKFYLKNKKLMFKIRKLEAGNEIQIARKITLEEFNNALKKWEREEITV